MNLNGQCVIKVKWHDWRESKELGCSFLWWIFLWKWLHVNQQTSLWQQIANILKPSVQCCGDSLSIIGQTLKKHGEILIWNTSFYVSWCILLMYWCTISWTKKMWINMFFFFFHKTEKDDDEINWSFDKALILRSQTVSVSVFNTETKNVILI